MKRSRKLLEKDQSNVILKNELITIEKTFKPYELKIYYKLLQKYTYRVREEGIKDPNITMDNIDVKKIINNGRTDLSRERYLEKLHSMKTWMCVGYNPNIYSKSMLIIITLRVNEKTTTFTLHPDICSMADEASQQYGVIKLLELSKLNNAYVMKAYELCCRYKGLKGGFKMTIDRFREFFDIPQLYTMSDIDERVLNPIVKDINNNTRFKLNVKKTKITDGRSISHIQFYIEEDKEQLYFKKKGGE